MRVAELERANLDYWVAKALGWDAMLTKAEVFVAHGETFRSAPFCIAGERGKLGDEFRPSTQWSKGGPIIERERMAIIPSGLTEYTALSDMEWLPIDGPIGKHAGIGPTPLIAAMRCFVASKFGEEVPAEAADKQQ